MVVEVAAVAEDAGVAADAAVTTVAAVARADMVATVVAAVDVAGKLRKFLAADLRGLTRIRAQKIEMW